MLKGGLVWGLCLALARRSGFATARPAALDSLSTINAKHFIDHCSPHI